jgi:hypothetical protein
VAAPKRSTSRERTLLRGPRRLAVHDRRAGRRFAVCHLTDTLAQGAVDPLPGAVDAPGSEVMVDGQGGNS